MRAEREGISFARLRFLFGERRGTEDAGAKIDNEIDLKTGLPIISLYGKNKKPTSEQLKEIDVVVFDIQDVGARFYTYISTLHYLLEACGEDKIKVVVLC